MPVSENYTNIYEPEMNENKVILGLKNYNYQVKLEFLLTADDEEYEKIDISEFITEFSILEHYEDLMFDIFKLDLTLPINLIKKMQEHIDEYKFLLNINKFILTSGNEIDELTLETIIKDKILLAIDFDRGMLDSKQDDNNEEVPDHPITMDLMLEEHLEFNKKIINKIYHNSTLKDIILDLFNEAGITMKNILMNDPNNYGTYEQVLIPNLNFTNSILYLQKYFGIYDKGIKFFLSINDYFLLIKEFDPESILNEIPIITESEKDWELVHVRLTNTKDVSRDFAGCMSDDENEKFIVKEITEGRIDNSDFSNRELNGEDLLFIYSTFNEHVIKDERIGDLSVLENKDPVINSRKGTKKQQFYKHHFSNVFNINEFIDKHKRSSFKLRVIFQEMDIDYIKLNRKFYIDFSNPKHNEEYKGSYQLYSKEILFESKGNGKYFSSKELCTFEKIK